MVLMGWSGVQEDVLRVCSEDILTGLEPQPKLEPVLELVQSWPVEGTSVSCTLSCSY